MPKILWIYFFRKRNEWEYSTDDKPIEADSETIGVELHKDSRFSQSWQNFKDKNPMVNKFVDYRSDIANRE